MAEDIKSLHPKDFKNVLFRKPANGTPADPVANVTLDTNAHHRIDIEPPSGAQQQELGTANKHRFVIQVLGEEHTFCLIVNHKLLFDETCYNSAAQASRQKEGQEKNHVLLGTLCSTVSARRGHIDLFRGNERVAILKSGGDSEWSQEDGTFISSLNFLVPSPQFKPLPHQAVWLRMHLFDLHRALGIVNRNLLKSRKLVLQEDLRSQVVQDIAEYTGKGANSDGNKHCDVKIVCDGEEIACHKFMLCARSSVLRMILCNASKEAETGIINIEDLKPSAVRQFVRFLYTEKIDKDTDVNTLAMLLQLADKYDVSTLTKVCCQKLHVMMNTHNSSYMLRIGRMFKLDLEEVAKNYVAGQAKAVIKTNSWRDLLHSDPEVANDIIMKLSK